MPSPRTAALLAATLLVGGGGSNALAQAPAPTSPLAGWRYETWFHFRNNSESSDYSQQGKAVLRLYQPFELDNGWRLTMREDIFGINTNQTGQDNRDQQWRSNIGDIFVQGSLATPQMATDLNADLGLRVIFPTGGLKPFGDGYYQLAPHVGLDFKRVAGFEWLGFAPLARYFRTVGATVPHGTDISQVQFHPVVSVRFDERWSVTMWEENPIIVDMLTNGWFVPADALVKFQVSPGFSVALGAAARLVQSYAQYDNMIYGRFSQTF